MTNTSTFIIPTSLKNSCYDFKIEHNGRNCYAELTYNLNDSPPTRRLLRLKERDALSLFPDLNNNREFQQIRSQIKDLQVRGIGNMSIAKGLVLEQYQSTFNNPELGIAVHRMGPVPVFLLPAWTCCLHILMLHPGNLPVFH